jgi:methyl-accepting chemotaxis protein
VLIRTRLLLGLGMVAATTLAQGVYGSWTVAMLNHLVTELYDRALVTGVAAQSARASFITLDRALKEVGHAGSPDALTRAVASAEAADRFFADDLAVLAERVRRDGQGRALLADVEQTYAAWKPGWARALAAARGGDAAAAAAHARAGDDAAAAARIEARLTMLAEEASQTGFAFRTSAEDVGRRALRVTYVAVAIAVAVAAGVWLALRRGVARPLTLLVRQLDELAAGRLTRRLAVSGRDEFAQLASAANRMADNLQESLRHLTRMARATTSSSDEVAEVTAALAGGTSEQATSVEETAASLEQIAAAARQNSESAQMARTLASEARTLAEAGGQVTREAVEGMSAITAAATRMGEIIGAVDEIAFQTNLLALNAAVEAARAGEHGRGFAVVASEVRSLAQRSAVAAREIKDLIRDSGRKIDSGAAMVARSGETLHAIVEAVTRVSAIVHEIAGASGEQARGIEELTRANGRIDDVVQDMAARAEELSATAETLRRRAADLQVVVERFTVEEGEGALVPPTAPSAPVVPGPAAGSRAHDAVLVGA